MEIETHIFRFDDVEVREREFSLSKAGNVFAIEPKAFRVLLFLLRNPQKVVSKQELLNTASGARSRWLWAIAAGGVIIAGAALLVVDWWRRPPPSPVVDAVTQLTDDGQIKGGALCSDIRSGRLATDGLPIYFNEGPRLTQTIGQVSVMGGPTARVETRLVNPTIAGVTRDGAGLIVLAGGGANLADPLWTIPLPAGEPRRLGSAEVDAAGILPDGTLPTTARLFETRIPASGIHRRSPSARDRGHPAGCLLAWL